MLKSQLFPFRCEVLTSRFVSWKISKILKIHRKIENFEIFDFHKNLKNIENPSKIENFEIFRSEKQPNFLRIESPNRKTTEFCVEWLDWFSRWFFGWDCENSVAFRLGINSEKIGRAELDLKIRYSKILKIQLKSIEKSKIFKISISVLHRGLGLRG